MDEVALNITSASVLVSVTIMAPTAAAATSMADALAALGASELGSTVVGASPLSVQLELVVAAYQKHTLPHSRLSTLIRQSAS